MATPLTNWQAFAAPILATIKNLVPKRVYRGIQLLTNPCCTPVIESIDFTCTDTDVATVVITLAKPVNLLGLGTAIVYSSVDGYLRGTITVTDSDTITITGATITAAANYTLTLFMPTARSGSQVGVFLVSDVFAGVDPACA